MNELTPLVLASGSPRRRELLAYLGLPFTVLPSRFEEPEPDSTVDPVDYAVQQALNKAREVGARHPHAAVLGADTIVVDDGRILGKPADENAARQMLRQLRGRSHEVITALALVSGSNEWHDAAETAVHMRHYSDDEIDAYIARGEPFDKAGSYAIQDRRFRPVERCDGCYCNVVGLPLLPTRRLLDTANIELLNFRPPDLPPECHRCPLMVRTVEPAR